MIKPSSVEQPDLSSTTLDSTAAVAILGNAGGLQTLQTTRLRGHLSADGKLTERWATLKSQESPQ